MKTISILLVTIMISVITYAQEPQQLAEIKVTPPQFTGITNTAQVYTQQNYTSFENYLIDNIKYPEKAYKYGCQGTEVVQFVVSADGKLTDYEVINSVSSHVDKAVHNFLKTTCGMWKPGENNGEPVSMQKEISIVFDLTGKTDFDKLAIKYLSKGTEQLFINNNPKKAMRYLNHGMKYRPNEDCLLVSRGICKYELGDINGAYSDWDRMTASEINKGAIEMVSEFAEMKGYNSLKAIIENK